MHTYTLYVCLSTHVHVASHISNSVFHMCFYMSDSVFHCVFLYERLDPWCSSLPLTEVCGFSETSHQGAR